MKKKIIGIILLGAMALAASWEFSQNKKDVQLSDLVSSNVEALAGHDIRPVGCWYKYGDPDCNVIKGDLACACV